MAEYKSWLVLCTVQFLALASGVPITNNNSNSSQYLPVSVPDSTTEPPVVVDNGDKVRKEKEYTTPALRYIQTFLVDVLQPKPIVDTIKEEDKYGNDGGKLDVVGRGFVLGVEKLTNVISSAVDIPFDVLKSITRKATATLNSIGSRLVGI